MNNPNLPEKLPNFVVFQTETGNVTIDGEFDENLVGAIFAHTTE